jgi:hypothetical protein
MSFGGYAAPFVQGGSSRRASWRRTRGFAPLVAGILVGAVVLTLVLVAARSLFDAVTPTIPAVPVALAFTALAVTGDLWAIGTRRLYPFAPRRQARQTLMFRRTKVWRVAFTWGFDAGLSLGTYRVTSGLWVGAFAVIVGLVPASVALAYGAAFAAALVTAVMWPVRSGSPEDRTDAAARRIRGLGSRRWIPQSVYLGGLVMLVVGSAVGWIAL